MIQIEMLACNDDRDTRSAHGISHRCAVTVDEKMVGEMDLFLDRTHGRILETRIQREDLEYLDGLVKTAIHQMYWKGLITGSFDAKDSVLVDYLSKFNFPKNREFDEIHFTLEDFIDAARCKHG